MPGEGYVCSLLRQITVTTWSTWTMSKSPSWLATALASGLPYVHR
jgi:hypothetical protein